MPRWLKIIIGVFVAFFVILIIAWWAAVYYIDRNNAKILTSILSQVNDKINGSIKAGRMETALLQDFPDISVSIKDVLLRDSLWNRHKYDLLNAKDIKVSLNIKSLLRGVVNIKKVRVNDAQIYLYTDSDGYSNTGLFKTKSEKKTANNKKSNFFEIGDVRFNNVDFVSDNQKRFKNFNFHIAQLNAQVKYFFNGWDADINLKTMIKSFAFNTQKGSFLKDKMLKGTLIVHSNENAQTITFEQKKLLIGTDAYMIGAKIDFSKKEPSFQIDIKANDLLFQNIAKTLSPNISSKLLKFAVEQPISVIGRIIDNGNTKEEDPVVNVKMIVKNNKVTIPSGILTDCNFVGVFTNKEKPNKPIGDENSTIKFFQLKANYYNVPIGIDTFAVSDLTKPIAEGIVKSRFELVKLNSSVGGDIYQFNNGNADLQLYCKADIDNFRFTKPAISGKVAIKNADIFFKPRNMHIVKSSLLLNFNQKDLSISGAHFQLGKNTLNINCYIRNFLNFYYTDPNKAEINLAMKSPQLYIDELLPFLAPRKGSGKKIKSNNSLKEVSVQLNEILKAARVQIKLNVNKAFYNKFVANNLNANILLYGNRIYFNRVGLSHADGSISCWGNIKQQGTTNQFILNSHIKNVNVKKFFYTFDDFGQKGITHTNLKGFLSAVVNARGSISDKGHIVKKSMYGTVNFDLKKAALQNFEPLQKIILVRIAFINRNLSNIAIDDLKGKLTLNGDKIYISPLQVSTSVLNFDMEGVYGIERGTDIALDIPLRNPKKDKNIIDKKALKKARMRGIVLRLRAMDDGKGGLKIKWRGKNKEKQS